MSEPVPDLTQRLAAAERVCALVGINASDRTSDRGKALTQAYLEWSRPYRHLAASPTDEEILELAARRDVVENHVRIREWKRREKDLLEACKITFLEALYEREERQQCLMEGKPMPHAHDWGEWIPFPAFPAFAYRDCSECNRRQVRPARKEET